MLIECRYDCVAFYLVEGAQILGSLQNVNQQSSSSLIFMILFCSLFIHIYGLQF